MADIKGTWKASHFFLKVGLYSGLSVDFSIELA